MFPAFTGTTSGKQVSLSLKVPLKYWLTRSREAEVTTSNKLFDGESGLHGRCPLARYASLDMVGASKALAQMISPHTVNRWVSRSPVASARSVTFARASSLYGGRAVEQIVCLHMRSIAASLKSRVGLRRPPASRRELRVALLARRSVQLTALEQLHDDAEQALVGGECRGWRGFAQIVRGDRVGVTDDLDSAPRSAFDQHVCLSVGQQIKRRNTLVPRRSRFIFADAA